MPLYVVWKEENSDSFADVVEVIANSKEEILEKPEKFIPNYDYAYDSIIQIFGPYIAYPDKR